MYITSGQNRRRKELELLLFRVKMFSNCLKLTSCGNLLRYSTSAVNNIGKIKSINILAFSDGDKSTILNTLNQDKHDNLCRLNVSQSQIQKLESWKSKKGPFLCINDVLDVEGIDIKDLAKILQSIVLDEPCTNNRKKESMRIRQILTPGLSTDTINTLTSVVGLHLGVSGISWVKLSCKTETLDVWGFEDFSDLSPKASPTEMFDLALRVLDDIPVGDVYIFEAPTGIGLQTQGQLGPMIAYTQQLIFNSILLTLLNTSEKHNRLNKTENKKFENAVFYLKAKLPARLFQTWVGTEKVSAIRTVEQLFIKTEFNLPCTPVHIDSTIEEKFKKQTSIYQELMCQSLLLGITFLDVCVYRNPISLQALSLTKRKR